MSSDISEKNAHLFQVSRSDIPAIKTIFSDGFNKFFRSEEFCNFDFDRWYDEVISKNKYTFVIRVYASADDSIITSKSWVVGICGLRDIDFISRHARIFFAMVDKDGHKSAIQPHPTTISAFNKLLKYCFDEMCMNKVSIVVSSNNEIGPTLVNAGFVAEGIRRKSRFYNGEMLDESVFSITSKEFNDRGVL